MKDSDVLLQWINDNYEQTNNVKDNVKLKDVFNKFKGTEYFTDMKKVDKRVITYNYFQSKLVANLFLKKLVKTNSDKTYCLLLKLASLNLLFNMPNLNSLISSSFSPSVCINILTFNIR